MIKGEASDDEIDFQLEGSISIKGSSVYAYKSKCAVLGWRTLNEMFKDGK